MDLGLYGICKKCNKEFVVQKGFANYCSSKCKNSRELSAIHKSKISESIKKRWKDGFFDSIDFGAINRGEEKINKNKETWTKKYSDMLSNGEPIHYQTIRRLLFKQRGYFCEICAVSEWVEKKITLEIHHIDGDSKNNDVKNLQILCPNCHSQTDNFRSKNKK